MDRPSLRRRRMHNFVHVVDEMRGRNHPSNPPVEAANTPQSSGHTGSEASIRAQTAFQTNVTDERNNGDHINVVELDIPGQSNRPPAQISFATLEAASSSLLVFDDGSNNNSNGWLEAVIALDSHASRRPRPSLRGAGMVSNNTRLAFNPNSDSIASNTLHIRTFDSALNQINHTHASTLSSSVGPNFDADHDRDDISSTPSSAFHSAHSHRSSSNGSATLLNSSCAASSTDSTRTLFSGRTNTSSPLPDLVHDHGSSSSEDGSGPRTPPDGEVPGWENTYALPPGEYIDDEDPAFAVAIADAGHEGAGDVAELPPSYQSLFPGENAGAGARDPVVRRRSGAQGGGRGNGVRDPAFAALARRQTPPLFPLHHHGVEASRRGNGVLVYDEEYERYLLRRDGDGG